MEEESRGRAEDLKLEPIQHRHLHQLELSSIVAAGTQAGKMVSVKI